MLTDVIGPVKSDPEYRLIVEAVDIDNEIGNSFV